MVDVDAKKLEGEMMDLQHGSVLLPNPKVKINASTGKDFLIIIISRKIDKDSNLNCDTLYINQR